MFRKLLSSCSHRVRLGHGKPGKSWNFRIWFSRPGKSWKLSIGHGKSGKWSSTRVLYKIDVAVAFSVNENCKKRKLVSHKLDPLTIFCKKKGKFRSWKTLKGPGKGHGKSWNFKMLKGYEPCHNYKAAYFYLRYSFQIRVEVFFLEHYLGNSSENNFLLKEAQCSEILLIRYWKSHFSK